MNVSKPLILFVDDDLHYVFPVVDRLESEGYVVQCQSDRERALTWLRDARNPRPDLVICDLMMVAGGGEPLEVSQRAGIELMKEIRILRIECPIIVLTGVINEETQNEAGDLASILLTKPATMHQICRSVREQLQKASSARRS